MTLSWDNIVNHRYQTNGKPFAKWLTCRSSESLNRYDTVYEPRHSEKCKAYAYHVIPV